MKKATAIFFLLTYLFATSELSQLLKLPALVNHFAEHKRENKDLTLWQFLCIHYSSDTKKDADYQKDQQLPFKTHDNCSVQLSPSAPPASCDINTPHAFNAETRKFFSPHDVLITSSYPGNIWQPPKSC